jgi:DNA-directed RNA polymerase specialized sigma24 family protein
MAKTRANATEPSPVELPRFEQFFQRLPPLGSDAYLAHIQSASASDLPPEVLARAFRQLPLDHPASRPTFERLIRRNAEGAWDYLGPLVARARRRSRISKHDDHEDILQDALRRIWQTIRTRRGESSERAWHAYCLRESTDAWRERYGRRGERLPRETQAEFSPEEGEEDPLSLVCEPPAWHGNADPERVVKIEEIMRTVISQIPDKYIRELATAAWLRGERPKVSRTASTPKEELALTDLFPGKSRHKLTRDLRKVDAQLAAALLTDPALHLDPDAVAWLEEIRAAGKSKARRPKEQES